MPETFEAVCREDGQRVDAYLASLRNDLSRAHLQRLIKDGAVHVNGRPVKPSTRLTLGDTLLVTIPDAAPTELLPQALPLRVLYEDADVIVVEKLAGMPVYPGPGHPDGTLANVLISRYPDMASVGSQKRPGIVHRLDMDTSGVMVVARTATAYLNLVQQIQDRSMEKVYLALVRGYPQPPIGTIDAPIGRSQGDRMHMSVSDRGREAITEYRTVRRYKGFALLEVRIHTGRTHQIRVHCAAMGHPVAGDAEYGGREPFLKRQFLHAHRLAFLHPVTGRRMEFTSELPEELQRALDGLEEAR